MKAPGAKCYMCPLKDEPFVPSEIRPGARLLVVGEAPGADEVRLQAPFVGQSGKLLDGALREAGYVRENVSLTNVVACRPPQNRTPEEEEIQCCLGRLHNDIKQADPGAILALGKIARETLIPESEGYRSNWCKLTLPTGEQYDALSTWHPAYVLRKPSEGTSFLKDVKKALDGQVIHPVQSAPQVIMPQTYEELAQLLSTPSDNSLVAYDLETNQVNWYDRPGAPANAILMMGIAWSTDAAVIITDDLLYDDIRVAPLLRDFFSHMRPVGHNIKFDNCFLRHHLGLSVHAFFDTLLAHYVLDENSKHGLKAILQEELGLPDYETALIKEFLKSANDEYSKIPYDRLAKYCAWDVVGTLALVPIFESRLYNEGLYSWPFSNLYMRAQEAMTVQQLRGVQVDVEYLRECSELFTLELERIQHEAGSLVGLPNINLNSPKQVGRVLWEQLKLPMSTSRKVKPGSTDELAVMHLRGRHPFVDLLMRYRRIAKLKSSYIDNMLEYVDVYGRIHPDVLLYGTEMGRISMRSPAVQTIPRPDDPSRPGYDPYEDGAVIRGAIIAAPGNMFGACDFSQAELRVLAYLSREPFLLQAYREGRDIHTEVTVAMFGENFTKEQRVQCKMFNFSYVYGGTEYSFAESAGLPVDVARAFVQRYNKVMPVANEWKRKQFQQLKEKGYVSTLFGQRRRFPLLTPDNQEDARKASVHAVVAGTAAAVTILAQTQLIEEGVPVVMSVHDSIEFESPVDEVERDAERVTTVMRETASKFMPEVPWKVDTEISVRWAEPPKL